jgi:hypothetical protein
MALAKYGTVLDCTNGGKVHEDSSSALTCDDKPGKNGGTVFKAGTNKNQHIVEVEQNGSGSTFALIHLWTNIHKKRFSLVLPEPRTGIPGGASGKAARCSELETITSANLG